MLIDATVDAPKAAVALRRWFVALALMLVVRLVGHSQLYVQTGFATPVVGTLIQVVDLVLLGVIAHAATVYAQTLDGYLARWMRVGAGALWLVALAFAPWTLTSVADTFELVDYETLALVTAPMSEFLNPVALVAASVGYVAALLTFARVCDAIGRPLSRPLVIVAIVAWAVRGIGPILHDLTGILDFSLGGWLLYSMSMIAASIVPVLLVLHQHRDSLLDVGSAAVAIGPLHQSGLGLQRYRFGILAGIAVALLGAGTAALAGIQQASSVVTFFAVVAFFVQLVLVSGAFSYVRNLPPSTPGRDAGKLGVGLMLLGVVVGVVTGAWSAYVTNAGWSPRMTFHEALPFLDALSQAAGIIAALAMLVSIGAVATSIGRPEVNARTRWMRAALPALAVAAFFLKLGAQYLGVLGLAIGIFVVIAAIGVLFGFLGALRDVSEAMLARGE